MTTATMTPPPATETMTKADEIERLRDFQRAQPVGGYLRDILAAIVPDIETAIRGDLGFIDFAGHVQNVRDSQEKAAELREEIKQATSLLADLHRDQRQAHNQLEQMRGDAEFVARRLSNYRD